MYNRVGRAAVKFAFHYLRRRYRREARIALGVMAVAAAGAVAYVARREVPEG
jgi:hypothetical protein